MSLSEALLNILNNQEKPFEERLKIAQNIFHASEFLFTNKKGLLLKWLLQNSKGEDVWPVTSKWLRSGDFKSLTHNDMASEDINDIIQIWQRNLSDGTPNTIEIITILFESNVFQQYFKYNIETYCQLISECMESVLTLQEFINFITRPTLFVKSVALEKQFSKHFMLSLYGTMVKMVIKWSENENVFKESSSIIEKCLLQGKIKQFQSYFNCHIFGLEEGEEKDLIQFPKSCFKYLKSTLQLDSQEATDQELWYKCLITLTDMIQFSMEHFELKTPQKHCYIKLSAALNVFSALLEVLSHKSFSDSTVKGVTLTDFLRKMLKSLINLSIINATVTDIVLKCILINPLIIEPLANDLIVFLMLGNEPNEELVIAIFEVFSKLHRLESFIAKLIPVLKKDFMASEKLSLFEFKGEKDMMILSNKEWNMENVFTESVLSYFSKCLMNLASWQVVNIFKTLLHHLTKTIEEYVAGKFDDEPNRLIFLELLGTLTIVLLQSIKITDYTIPQNVIGKFVSGLDELKTILNDFAKGIIEREHSHVTMRTFLRLAFTWAEVYLTLAYYSTNNEVQMTRVKDGRYSAENLSYLHSYLDGEKWQLIGQRITNFGKRHCKILLQKLYVQKLKAMVLMEKHVKHEWIVGIAKTVPIHLQDTWQDLLEDKFFVNVVLKQSSQETLNFFAEQLMKNEKTFEKNHIKDSALLTMATTYFALSKINGLFRVKKRKRDLEQNQGFSHRVFNLLPQEAFFDVNAKKTTKTIKQIKHLFEELENIAACDMTIKEEKFLRYLSILKNVLFIYCDDNVQKLVLLYLVSLHKDVGHCSCELRQELEELIIGVIQATKFPISSIVDLKILLEHVIFSKCSKYDLALSLVIDNTFKYEDAILQLEPLVLHIVKSLKDPQHLGCCLLILQAIDKLKKSKMSSPIKDKGAQYKEAILNKMSKLVCKSDSLVRPYAICLKHHLTFDSKEDSQKVKLLQKLDDYLEYALTNINVENKKGCTALFTTVLQNKSKIPNLKEKIVSKIWTACTEVSIDEEDSHLISLIVSVIGNEEFEPIIEDLLDKTLNNDVDRLKTWESILACDVNPIKMKVLQEALQKLIYQLQRLLTNQCDTKLFNSIVNLEQCVIRTQHFILSPPLIDMFLLTPSILMTKHPQHFSCVYSLSISILELLLKHRNPMIMDRLPVFLQQYRLLLKAITSRSDSDESNTEKLDVKIASDCVHRLEKLTKSLVGCKRDMGRIVVFLIADILERYEQVNLYPNVKLHLNNCVYSLISLCDQHAVSYLMRALSSASTEMFKIMYEHYKKYYMFTGKV